MNIAMTIAGSDSGGGAGIQADLKTFQELGVFGTSAITALTAQNTLGVEGIYPAQPEFVQQQIEVVMRDMPIKAVKTGMLFSAEIIEAVAHSLRDKETQLVVDPVMIAKGGASLLQHEAVTALKKFLLPRATILTPNIPEAEVISGIEIKSPKDLEKAANAMLAMGVSCVIIKGGHLEGKDAVDTVFFQDDSFFSMQTKRISTVQTHGTGCTFSAALTAFLAQGFSLKSAIIEAKKFVHLAIQHPLNIGNGHGPTNHFAYKKLSGNCEVTISEERGFSSLSDYGHAKLH
ncbi:bifunctional hydroxymethylpyrimidine kinase/phosphomethylpyrimidine kinase [Rummeliibacillus sp. G93]|uniref:bifunctional hydroxymethylpyrimidine kinase/phosphomethylpyrimidine kinase n=1 Tax=Rummeliibacillus sp. G93 TaxID=2939494 RepID=UPI00201C2677|nr:bifunctional hydroxymethylpyrimidine kinase/phosphomethylpyrimidine kinase [Rummeliibacillus sp. G93]UQW97196.1 bifunctional hydroxymethylpyrimidine kinase/phosphomethylpyrimidine kinase [Rummeliibacillus sp. G93]